MDKTRRERHRSLPFDIMKNSYSSCAQSVAQATHEAMRLHIFDGEDRMRLFAVKFDHQGRCSIPIRVVTSVHWHMRDQAEFSPAWRQIVSHEQFEPFGDPELLP